jgi:lysozyme family protein
MSFEDVYFKVTVSFEGGYVNDPDDSGGETYKGISRKSHPNWPGWAKVDAAKAQVGTKASAIDRFLASDQGLKDLVAKLYKDVYWTPLDGNPEFPDRIKQKLFDTSVNMGQRAAVKILQKALNLSGERLAVDGFIGPLTRKTANEAKDVLKNFVKCQSDYYRSLVAKNPKNKKFLTGWLNRASWVPQ